MKTRIYAANFHPLEVVSRYRDPQLQVTENLLEGQRLVFAVEHCVMSTITSFRFFTACIISFTNKSLVA